jgi:hypothetical protein
MNERIQELRRAHLAAWQAAAAESLLNALGWSEPERAAEAMRKAEAATQALAAESLQEANETHYTIINGDPVPPKTPFDGATMGENHEYAAFLQPGKRICVQCGKDVLDGPILGHTCLACYNANGFRQFREAQP